MRATRSHGDLHAENILRSGGSWLAIDPKPLVGDPAFDLAQWLGNGCRWLLSERRVDQMTRVTRAFADLAGVDPVRAAGWAFVKKVAWGSELDVAHALLKACEDLGVPR
jgi:streptomycin 6-kinase